MDQWTIPHCRNGKSPIGRFALDHAPFAMDPYRSSGYLLQASFDWGFDRLLRPPHPVFVRRRGGTKRGPLLYSPIPRINAWQTLPQELLIQPLDAVEDRADTNVGKRELLADDPRAAAA